MFSKTLLQPNASGTGDTSPESEAARRAEEFIKESFVVNPISGFQPKFILSKNIDGPWTQADMSLADPGKIPKVQNIYTNPEDQALYSKLRKSGLTAAETRDTLKMMGVEPSAQAPDPIASFWGDVQYNKKKELPYFHGKRRF